MEVDSRPSDALALAVRVEAPIYVEEAVLDKAGILLDQETGKPLPQESEREGAADKGKKPSDEELKKMSASSLLVIPFSIKMGHCRKFSSQ